MPFLNLVVNVKVDDPKSLALDLSRVGASALGRPESLISVLITYDETLTFGGTLDPAFNLRIICVDRTLGNEASKQLSDWVGEKLGIPNDRGFILFFDPGNVNVGFKGTTLD